MLRHLQDFLKLFLCFLQKNQKNDRLPEMADGRAAVSVQVLAQQLAQLYQDSSYTIQGTAPDVTNFDESTPCQTVTLFRGYPGIEIDAEALYNDILEGYNTGSFAVSYQGTVSAKKPVSPDLDGLWEQTRLAPEDPSVDLTSYQVIPGVHGYEFDLAEARQQFQNLAYGESTISRMS